MLNAGQRFSKISLRLLVFGLHTGRLHLQGLLALLRFRARLLLVKLQLGCRKLRIGLNLLHLRLCLLLLSLRQLLLCLSKCRILRLLLALHLLLHNLRGLLRKLLNQAVKLPPNAIWCQGKLEQPPSQFCARRAKLQKLLHACARLRESYKKFIARLLFRSLIRHDRTVSFNFNRKRARALIAKEFYHPVNGSCLLKLSHLLLCLRLNMLCLLEKNLHGVRVWLRLTLWLNVLLRHHCAGAPCRICCGGGPPCGCVGICGG
ncbi:hypothetical protein [Acetobacter sp.]|uniref:hypothetical protein n=1 Tax=Acetobacter sp. TaxID=440 RepID=UPI0039E7A4F7